MCDFMTFFIAFSQFYVPNGKYRIRFVVSILTPKLRITDLGLSTTEFTEVSVVFLGTVSVEMCSF